MGRLKDFLEKIGVSGRRERVQTISEKLDEILEELRSRDPKIKAAMLFTEEGFPLASSVSSQVKMDLYTIASLFSSVASIAASVMEETSQGKLKEVIMEAEEGVSIVSFLPGGETLAIIASPEAKMGILMGEIRRSINHLVPLLEKLHEEREESA